MLVFRFEHEDGKGAYQRISYEGHNKDDGHPGPDDDIADELAEEIKNSDKPSSIYYTIGYIREKWGYNEYGDDVVMFGFASLKDAYTWFNREEVTEKQLPKGVHLRAYTVPEESVVKYKSQIVFDINKATRL